ncbi:TfuA-like protein [Amycolatopsis sp. cg5]|uniref:TfuA-like protein n=1 Tax=Amycolatopsis sp. cg5 TaxID=3238802 RepID=UPI0035242080
MPGEAASGVLPEAVLHPPAAHGDLLRLGCAAGDVVVLVDGYYHHHASVRHKEVLALLSAGVRVVGCASMGALRAAELYPYGMTGNGVVFRMYRDGVVDADDEVAVTHGEGPDYRKFSVPLVTIRHLAEVARTAGVVSDAEARAVVESARKLHYTERTWPRLRASGLAEVVARLEEFAVAHPAAADVKVADTLDTLTKIARREIVPAGETPEWARTPDWRNRFLDEWRTRFSVTEIDGVEVSRADVIRYHQLYAGDFPARWRKFALGQIAGGADVLAEVARFGLTPESLTEAQTAEWLTNDEIDRLSPEEALIRVLVRSLRIPSPTYEFAAAEPLLAEDPLVRRKVAESHAVNAEVATWPGRRGAEHLKRAVLIESLARAWDVDGNEEGVVLAAARDRGFRSLGDAAGAARLFFLHRRFRELRRDAT